jgi:hypothetical protein
MIQQSWFAMFSNSLLNASDVSDLDKAKIGRVSSFLDVKNTGSLMSNIEGLYEGAPNLEGLDKITGMIKGINPTEEASFNRHLEKMFGMDTVWQYKQTYGTEQAKEKITSIFFQDMPSEEAEKMVNLLFSILDVLRTDLPNIGNADETISTLSEQLKDSLYPTDTSYSAMLGQFINGAFPQFGNVIPGMGINPDMYMDYNPYDFEDSFRLGKIDYKLDEVDFPGIPKNSGNLTFDFSQLNNAALNLNSAAYLNQAYAGSQFRPMFG